MTGEGGDEAMFESDQRANRQLVTEPVDAAGNYPKAGAQEFVQVPLYDVRAAAGFGAFIDDRPSAEALAFRRDWIERQVGARVADLSLVYVVGDSMEPILSDGDVIMVNRAERSVRQDAIYVVRIGDALLVKKLQRLPGGLIKVFSENSAYEPYTVKAADLESDEGDSVVGRVVWAGKKF